MRTRTPPIGGEELVIPAKAGIQLFLLTSFPRKRESIFLFVLSFNKGEELDSGFRRNDEREK